MKAILPCDEAERLKALARYKILDTEAERTFDDITLLASHVCRTPIALISLVDENRQWFKSKIGLIESETSRDVAFCAHGILEPDLFEVEDALADERFATNPLVTGNPKIRFYAGSPLVTPAGHALGMLCVMDQVSRELSPSEKAALKALSRQVVAQLELRCSLAERKESEEALRESEERFRSYFELGQMGVAITSPVKGYVEVNDELCRILGYERSELLKKNWAELTHPDDLAADVAQFNRVLAGEIDSYSRGKRFIRKDGKVIDATVSVKCLRRADGSVGYFVALLQDITERKHAEERLRQSEERMRAILESALDCIVTMDHLGRVVEFNPAAEKSFGYKRAATIGQLMDDLIIPPRLRERHRRGLAHYLSTGEAAVLGQRIELTGMRSDHSEFPVELAITRVGSQEPPMFTGFMRDITERKQAEKALAEQAIRYKTLMETSADSIYILDTNGELQEANAEFLQRRGYSTAEVKGLNLADWDARWTREELQERMRQLVGGNAMFETRHRCKDGSVFDAEVGATSVRIAGQELFFCVTRDITERKQAERARHESDERFRQLAENISAIFWVWTAVPGNAQCLYVSPAYATIWGRSCESLYSSPQSWKKALHPNDKERVLAEIANLDIEKISDWTYRIVRPDQSIRWIRDRIFPVRDRHGGVVRFAGIAEDITESKEAEEAVRKANRQLKILSRRRIQEQEEERRRLSRELHDQIGQSLTAAKINVEVLRSATSPTLAGRVDETAAILDRLLGQVRQISLDLRPPMLDDLGLVPALRSLLDEQGRRASVATRFSAENIPENLDPEIQTTCFRIAQEAITNVVRHAKATQVDIALRYKNGKTLQLLVRDNGIGFNARSAQAQAVDLGLIGMKERASLVGGRARIMSLLGKGTTISVSLPLTFQPERQGHHMGK
jgi:PAS domain S-box-containing protein